MSYDVIDEDTKEQNCNSTISQTFGAIETG